MRSSRPGYRKVVRGNCCCFGRSTAQHGLGRACRPTRERPRRSRRILQVGVAAALLGAALALTSVLQSSAPSAAASVLRHLAKLAATQSATVPLGPGQYLYVDSDEESLTIAEGPDGVHYSYLQVDHRQVWIAANGSGRLIDHLGQPTFLTPADETTWRAAGSPAISTASSDTAFGPNGLSDSPSDLASLPTDPTTLGAEIAQRKIEGGPPGPGEDFIQVGDLLRETDASPALRSALFQVAASLPGVESLGSVMDQAGRSGVGLAIVTRGVRYELIFDSSTSALLGEQETIADDTSGYEAPVGTLIGWAVYVRSTIVNSLPPSSSITHQAPSSPPPGPLMTVPKTTMGS